MFRNLLKFVFYGLICAGIAACDSDDEGANIFIYDTWITDPVDIDGDGLLSSVLLHIDVDTDQDSPQTVFVKIYRGDPWVTSLEYYGTTPEFEIVADSANDEVAVKIGYPNRDFYGHHELKVEVFKAGMSNRSDMRDASMDASLQARDYEYYFSDTMTVTPPPSPALADAWWVEDLDRDQDGFWSSRKLIVELNRTVNWEEGFYARLFYKPADSVQYAVYECAPGFECTNTFINTWNDIYSPIKSYSRAYISIGGEYSELSHGLYDFKVELWKSGLDSAWSTLDTLSDPDLSAQPFEKGNEE